MMPAEALDYIADMRQTESLERIAVLTEKLRAFYLWRYDGPSSESLEIIEEREELGELLAGRGAGVYAREQAVEAAIWRRA